MQNQQTYTQDIQTPLVSFIITAYNLPSEYLKDCIQSILQLSLKPQEREIILIDDGSDSSPIKDFPEYQSDIIYQRQDNQGLSVARNKGLELATGKFIQFVDGDDYLLQEAYEYCLNLARLHNPDIVYFELTDKEVKETSSSHTSPVNGSCFLCHNNLHGSACSYLFKASILKEQRFTPGILHEDEEFTPLLFLKAEQIITTHAKAYFYRTRQDSIMHQKSNKQHNLKRLADTELVLVHLQKKLESLSGFERKALERRIAQLTMDYLYNTILLTGSIRHLEEAIKQLHNKGLYPLPEKKYTKKYQLFRKAIGSKLGRRLMVFALSRIKQ